MKIYVVSIGNEIVEGSIVDTNSNFIAKELFREGYRVNGFFVIGDDLNGIVKLLKSLTEEESVIITTGGLGPTFDDNTTEAIAKACKREIKLNRKAYFDVLKKVKAKGVKLKLSHTRQALLPDKCELLPNRHGTAAGLYLKCNKAHIFALPGVPTEMKPMFLDYCLPKIKEILPPKGLHRADLKLIGVAESDMDRFILSLPFKNAQIILNAMEGELAVRVISEDKKEIENIKEAIKEEFGYKLYSQTNETIENTLSELLERLDLKIGFLESITAGYLAQLMYDKPVFVKSIVNQNNTEIDNIPQADIVVCPCNLVGNEFDLKMKINSETISTTLKYLGNVNFMRKSISKRTLGFVYQYLVENYD